MRSSNKSVAKKLTFIPCIISTIFCDSLAVFGENRTNACKYLQKSLKHCLCNIPLIHKLLVFIVNFN